MPPRASDVYVAARTLGGVWKASLHQSGRCHLRVPQAAVPAPNNLPVEQRFMDVWERADVLPGISHPLSVFIPESELRPIEWGREKPKDTVWLPRPAPGFAVEVSIVLTRPDAVLPPEWPGRGIRPLLEADLVNGDRLWALWHAFEMGDAKERQLHDDKQRALQLSAPALQGRDNRNVRVLLFGHNERSRFFLEAAAADLAA